MAEIGCAHLFFGEHGEDKLHCTNFLAPIYIRKLEILKHKYCNVYHKVLILFVTLIRFCCVPSSGSHK
jgi:hypothetical protein